VHQAARFFDRNLAVLIRVEDLHGDLVRLHAFDSHCAHGVFHRKATVVEFFRG